MTSYHGDVSFNHFLISHLKLIKRNTRTWQVDGDNDDGDDGDGDDDDDDDDVLTWQEGW